MAGWGARWQRFSDTLVKRALTVKSVDEHLSQPAEGSLRQVLSATDLIFLGIGCIIGAGVYVLSGVAASEHAGPSVILSYMIAALAALLSAFCYSEFAVEVPVSGGAFNYISITFGELAAWLTSWNMILEIMLSSAAVARGFASYLATLCGLSPADVRFQLGPFDVDLTALLLIGLLTSILAKGTKESALFNMVVVSCNLAVILFILFVGLPEADSANLQPFLPFGARGMFSAASIVFFGYVGFDYLANAAEEAIDPAHTLPIGLLCSLAIATLLYALMAACLVLMVPYNQIDINAPFSDAFVQRGLAWAGRVVSAGATFGIVASTMTGLLGMTRLFVVLGRSRLLPAWLAHIHPQTRTPLKATLLTGALSGALAVCLDIGVLAELVSVGTLFVFAMVCAALVHRRYFQPGRTPSCRPVVARLAAIVVTSTCTSVTFTFGAPWPVAATFLLLWLLASLSLYLLPLAHVPERFRVPLFPMTPCLGMLVTIHLIGSLGWPAYVRFVVWMLAGVGVYCGYGVHAAEESDRQADLRKAAEEDGAEEQYELPFSLPALEHEGPLHGPRGGGGFVELRPWQSSEQQAEPSPVDEHGWDRAVLLGSREGSEAAGHGGGRGS